MISIIFLGIVFVAFVTIYFINHFCKENEKANNISNWVLLACSYCFVLLIDYRFLIILLLLTLSTWFFAKHIKYSILGIVIAILTLAFFKYFNFFVNSFTTLFHLSSVTINIILPLGVSFYTFSAIGYIVDVKRQKIEAQNIKDVALYLAFFPKIISGPIMKSTSFFSQEHTFRKIGLETFLPGIQIFVFGLFKKIVLSDTLSVFVDQVFGAPGAFSSGTIVLAVFSYSLQIYLDFSGYSDMAIGIGKMFGFDLPKNFDLPYLSHNVTEFWKRWHITLSEWLQEYLYIPLGGNRKTPIRSYFNLVIVMLIGGLWHGANWTFVIWGLLHGIALVFHKLWMKITHSPAHPHLPITNVLSIAFTYVFVCFCWIFFRASSITNAFTIIQRIFLFKPGITHIHLWTIVIGILFVVGTIFIVIFSTKRNEQQIVKKFNVCKFTSAYPIMDLSKFWCLVIFFSLCALTLCLAFTGGSPFIYGNF